MPTTDATATAIVQPVAVVSPLKLKASASHGIPSVARPSAIAPNARTCEITPVRSVESGKADPIRPQKGTSHTVYANPHRK